MEEDKRRKLYDALNREYGDNFSTFDNFKEGFKDESAVRRSYGLLRDAGIPGTWLGDEDTFVGKFVNKAPSGTKDYGNVSVKPGDNLPGRDGVQEDAVAMCRSYVDKMQQARQAEEARRKAEEEKRQADMQAKRQDETKANTNKDYVMSHERPEGFGKRRDNLLDLSLGEQGRDLPELGDDAGKINERIKAVNRYYKGQDPDKLTGNEFDRVDGNLKKAREEYDKAMDENSRATSDPKERERRYQAKEKNMLRRKYISAAEDLMDESKRLMNAVKKGKDGTMQGNLARGFKDGVFNLDTWTLGITDGLRAMNIKNVIEKVESGKELTEDEQNLMDALLVNAAVNQSMSKDLPRAYKAGMTTGQSVPFMVEMMTGTAGVQQVTSHLGRGLLKYASKWMAKRAAKGASNKIARQLIEGGYGLAKGVVDSAINTASIDAARVGYDYTQRTTGDAKYTFDDNGKITYDGRENVADESMGTWLKSFTSTALETQSELIGEQFLPIIRFMGRGMLQMPGLKQAAASDWWKTLSTTWKNSKSVRNVGDFMNRTQFHGVLGEYAEEVYNNIISYAMGDMTKDELTDLDNNIDTFLGVGVQSAFFGLIGTGAYVHDRYKWRKEIKAFEGTPYGAKIREEVSGMSLKDAREYLKSIGASTELDEDEKKGIMRYVTNLINENAFKEFATSRAEESGDPASAQVTEAVQESYDSGADAATPQEKQEVKQRYDAATAALNTAENDPSEQQFASLVQENSPQDGYAALRQQGYDEEHIQRAMDYYNARAAYEGLQDTIIDSVDQKVEDGKKEVDANTHKESGMVIPVTDGSSNRAGHLISGNLVRNGDGTVDAENSDQVLIVRGEDGQQFMASPKNLSVTGEALSPDEMKQQIETTYRQSLLEEASAEVDPQAVQEGEEEAQQQEEQAQQAEEQQPLPDPTPQAAEEQPIEQAPVEQAPEGQQDEVQPETQGEAQPQEPAAGQQSATPMQFNEHGEEMYESVDPQVTLDYLSEGSDEDEVSAMIEQNLDEAFKEYEKLKKKKPVPGKSKAAYDKAKAEYNAALEEAKRPVDYWKSVKQLQQQRIDAAKQEQLEAARQRAAQMPEEAPVDSEGAPDWLIDKPEDSRTRGFRMVGAEKVERQQPVEGLQGNETAVRFSEDRKPKGHLFVMEADQLQPSHRQGQRNPSHFIPEAQPKDRTDNASVLASQKIAQNINPEEITSTSTAYTGAPTVNARGEVVQGNNRSDALRQMWGAGYEEQAAKYKQYLMDHAEEFGLKKEDIEKMKAPVLVNRLDDVTDQEAIDLGQFNAADTESGGEERINAGKTIQRLGGKISSFIDMLMQGDDDTLGISDLLQKNGLKALKWLAQQGIITNTQAQSTADKNGRLTDKAVEDLKEILFNSVFQGANPGLRNIFNNLPAKAQRAILSTMYRDTQPDEDSRIKDHVQQAIYAYELLRTDEKFAKATTLEEARRAVKDWGNQYSFEENGNTLLNSDKFSNFALELAARFKGQTQKEQQTLLNRFFDLVQGVKKGDMFEEERGKVGLKEAVEETFGITLKEKDNGQNGSVSVAGDDTAGAGREQDGSGSGGQRERNPQGEGPAEPARGTDGNGTSGTEGAVNNTPIQGSLFDDGKKTEEETMDDFYENVVNEDAVDSLGDDESLSLAEIAVVNPMLSDMKPKAAWEWFTGLLGKASDKAVAEMQKRYAGKKDLDRNEKKLFDAVNAELERRGEEKVSKDESDKASLSDENKAEIESQARELSYDTVMSYHNDGSLKSPELWKKKAEQLYKNAVSKYGADSEEAIRQKGALDGLLQALDEIAKERTVKSKTNTKKKASKPAAPKKGEAEPSSPSLFENPLVTDERYEELKKRLRSKISNLNVGFDPEVLSIGMEMAAYHIERGAKKFVDFSREMIKEFGDGIRGYLKSFYNGARDMPGMESLKSEMTPYAEVDATDVANIGKETIDPMRTADMAKREKEVEEGKKKTEELKKETLDDSEYSLSVRRVGNRYGIYRTKRGAVPVTDERPLVTATSYIELEQILENPYNQMQDMLDESKSAIARGIRVNAAEERKRNAENNAGTQKKTVSLPKTDVAKKAKEEMPKSEEHPVSELTGDSVRNQQQEKEEQSLVIDLMVELSNRMRHYLKGKIEPMTMRDVQDMANKYPTLREGLKTDLQELVERAMTSLQRAAAEEGVKASEAEARERFSQIVATYMVQPNLNARDSTRVALQQYSTPTPFAFLMSRFIQSGGKKVESMLEPSAGNGALTIGFDKNIVHVNDIDDRRLANLRTFGFKSVTSQNGLMPFDERVDAVSTNPPFGTVEAKEYDGYKITSLEGQMAINALESMKDDGRAAIIIGEHTKYTPFGALLGKDKSLFGYLYQHYNVVDVINMDGEMYGRNGTKYPVRMILIDGRRPQDGSEHYAPVRDKANAEVVTTFDELFNRVENDILSLVQKEGEPAGRSGGRAEADNENASAARDGGSNTRGTERREQPVSDGERTEGGTSRGLRTMEPRTSEPSDRGGHEQSGEYRETGRVDSVAQGSDDGAGTDGQRTTDQERRDSNKPGGGRLSDAGGNAVRNDSNRARLTKDGDLEEKLPYQSKSENYNLGSVMPAVQADAVRKSLDGIGDVDEFVRSELGYSSKEELFKSLAAEQIDSVAMAINQMNKGNAFIIGDMTGIGKGRQGAALIRYAIKKGKKPIFFTQKPGLFSDMYRDLQDIGCGSLNPMIIASDADKANIVEYNNGVAKVVHKLKSPEVRKKELQHIIDTGEMPEGYDYAVITYSQIQNGKVEYEMGDEGPKEKPKKKTSKADEGGQLRRDAISRLAQGNYIILDESHTAGGQGNGGMFLQTIIPNVEGCTFMSATFAKRPDNMPIYAIRTDISKADCNAQELIQAIMDGGVTLQEIMSKQLAESGQMIRRERDFSGVTIDWIEADEEVDKDQRKKFDEVANIFNSIKKFQDRYVKPKINEMSEAEAERQGNVDQKKGTKDMGVSNVPFASKMYNMVNQLLFSMKCDAVVDRVLSELEAGRKPVISFTNTMGTFIDDLAGIEMNEMPTLAISLEKALDGVLRITKKDAKGNEVHEMLSPSELGPGATEEYDKVRDTIRNLTAELPISPIDYIQQKIKEAGYSVGEITGRERRLGVTDAGKYKVMNLTKQESDGKGNAAKFNSGDLDVLMVNKAGSTGISLHASTKFKDQRQRVMIFAQFQSDINDEIQMRGRIDRTGQVCRGVYQYLMSSIPAERRLQMMFKAKLKSLDANTTSSQKSKFNEMEVVDYLNKYGDEVVWDYMSDHPELEEEFGDPLKMFDEKGIPLATSDKKEGCAATISRYLAFLSVSEQEQVFNDITEAYKIKIQQLDEAGENDLEIVTMPLNAETKSTKIWKSGRDNESGNAFASDTYLEEAEVDVLKKPMKLNEVKSAVSSLSSGKPFNEWVEAKISDMKAFMQDKAKTRYAAAIERSKKKAEAAKDSARKKLLKEREKGKADLSDAQIEEMVKSVYDKSVSDGETVCYEALHSMDDRFAEMRRMLSMFEPGKPLIIPRDVLDKDKDESAIHLDLGTFIGYKVGREFTPSSSAAVFATLDGRRRVEIPLSQAKSLEYIKTATLVQGSYVRDMNIEADWDRKVPTKTRKTAYIITGNLMQALVDLNKTMQRYQLISFTMKDGTVRQGALLPEEFDPSSLKERVPISKSESEIAVGKTIASADKEVMIRAAIRSYLGDFEVHVPKSKQKGGKYFTDPALLKLMKYEEFQTIGGEMVGHFNKENLRKVLNRLDKLGVTVLKESKLEESKPQNTKRYRKVTDKRKIDELEQGPTVKLYRAMQLIGGKLYPPMAAKVNGKFVEPSELGKWEEAEERPEQIKSKDGKNKFTLNKGNGSQIDAAYNPYLHLSRSPLNDQFTSASQRPNLVTVEVEVPESELYSNYRAEGAKDTTGEMTWHAGPVSSRLPEGKKRKVVLSRWAKPVRIVPDKEVARKIADMLEGENIPIPSNTVTPSLRKELEALGVPVRDTDKKYRFIGEKGAAAIDQAKERDNLMQGLRAAKQMEQAGKDAKAIKLATGWERGADGLWRYEQPDFKLKTDNLREYMNPYIEKKAALEKEMETYRAKRIAKFEEMERMRKEHPENESTIDKLQKEFKEFYQKEEAARLDLDDYGYTYRVRDWEGAMLSDIIDEPELFDAYPILSHLHISASKRIEVDGAYYSPSHNAIEVGDGTKGEKLLSALIHEVQHAIQVQEGFARGGSETVRIPLDKEDIQRIENERDAVIAEMEEDKKKGLEENALARWQLDNLNKQLEIGTKTAGREGYMRIAGEVEARNAERRMNMTDEERRNSLASETEDKPRESQIILLDDVADGDRKALLGNDGGAYTDPAYAEAYSENNVNQAIYSVAGKYMKRLYAGGVLGRVLTGNNATINTDKAKKEFKLVSEVLGDYRKALESMAARCTDAALREIQAVMDEIDRSIEYYKQLADGKDVWRTEEGSRYRLADALGGLSDVSRSSHLAMAQRAASVAERLHTPVRLVMSLDELSEEDRGAMGWYDTATGEVVIVVPNHTSVSEIEESVFHEAVGHKSMNELLGEEGFNEFLNDIYMNCDEETRKRIARKFVDGMTLREATEEAIAEIAEDMAHGRKPTTWEALKSCLKAAARKALRKLGFEANFEMNENDILYALWKNAKQMERGDVLSAAQSIAMQRGLDTDFTGRRFRKVPTGTDYGTASQRYEAALNARSYRFREGFQDSMLALKELQDAVVAETKTKLKEWEDAYTMENQLSSKDTADIEIYQRDFFNPMINVFKRFLKKTGMTQAEGTRYLFAKSGLERNREFAVRDAINRVKGTDDVHPDLDAFIEHYYQEKYSCETDLDIGKITFEEFCERMDEVAKDLIALTYYGHDGKPRKDSKGKEIDTDAAAQLALERDYSGLSDIFDPDEFRTGAIACVLDTESRGGEESRQLWDRINAATKETLRKSRDCGVTSVETSQKVSGMFAWYIPMRGFDADMASDVYDYFGKGQGGFNATVKDAKGRLSLADNPLATIGNMAESAILQGNKNMMKTGLLNLAFSHPTHLLKVQKAWIENVGTDAVPVWQYAYPDILPTDSAEDIADKLRDFEDEMKDKQEKGLAKHEYNRLDIPYIKTPDIVPEHLIRVKRNGREYVLILNGNPRAAQAVNGLLSSRGDESRAKKLIQQINRFMAGAFTTKNPTFIVRNLSRDLIFANSAVIAKEPLDYGNRFRKNQFTVMKKVGKLLYLYKHGRLDESDEWQRYFSEFIRNGGETGFTQLHSVEEYKQRMANALKQRNVFVNAGREAWTALFDCIEFGNRCAEDVSRFTTYATSRQMGRSIQRSVADAKEITVNFNKKGSGAKAGGVTGIAADAVRTLYLFSNAAIQGLVNVGRISKAHPFKAGAVVASFMAMGLAQPALNELLFSVLGGGDGDDDPYNNLPDFVRHSNLCFYVGNINGNSNFFTIPLSIELRAFFGLGEMLSQYGEGNISAGDAATEFATSLCELTPINFLGSGGVIDSATPDFAKPVEQILQNTDFTGKPIYRKSSFNTAYPEWTKAYSGTSKMLVKGCKALNGLSGGDNVKSGMIDVNPAMVEHLVTGYTGGLGQTFIDVAKIMQMGMVPDYRNPRNVPIAKAFIRQSDERTSYASTKAQYQKYMEWYKEEQHLRSGYKKEVKKGGEDALEYADKQRHLLDGVNMKKFQTMKAFDKQVSALYKEIGSTEDEEIIKRDNGLILELKRRCVERMKSLEGR